MASGASRRRVARALLSLCLIALLSSCSDDDIGAAADFTLPGARNVTTEAFSLPTTLGESTPLDGQLWLPREPDDASTGPFPLVAFMPALGVSWDSYELLLEHTASYGFAVLALGWENQGRDPTTQALRLFDAITQLGAAHSDLIDLDNVVLVGHSHGGKVALLAASLDHALHDQIRTVIAWDPNDQPVGNDRNAVSVAPELMPSIRIPTLIYGTPPSDCVPVGDNHEDFFAAALSPSLHIFFPTADHTDWGDDYGEGVIGFGIARELCHRIGELNGPLLHDVTRRTQVAWLKRHVNQEPHMERYLTGAEAAADIHNGIIAITEK